MLRALLAGLAALLILTMALAPPAKAQLAGVERNVGPGFPEWYKDSTGLTLSGVQGEVDPANPTAPPETIYWSGEISLPAVGNGGSASLIMDLIGYHAFDPATAGDEITGATIKVNIRGLTPGQTYNITHPYGVATLTADAQGRIVEVLEEAGCDPHDVEDLGIPCNFAAALNSSIGPFLVWNPAAGVVPDGSIGDPDVAHEVVGSPNNTNFFRIAGPNVGGPGVNQVQTNLFNITGEVDGLAAFASLKGGTFEEAQSVTLAPSNSGANVFYTTDGSDPTNSATRVSYAGPINISQTSTLKFVAIGAEGQSPVFTERYVITPPTALSLNASSQALSFGQSATLSGQLSTNGAGLAGKPVILEQNPAGASSFSQVGAPKNTDTTGNFSFAVKPDKNTAYRVGFAGEQESFKPSLAAKQVNVKVLVSNNTATKNLKLGQSQVISGKVSPAHAGKVVKMTIKRPGQPALVRNLRLGASSNYKFTYKPNKVGRYSVSVQFAGDADHLGGNSVAKVFKVVR